MRFCEIFDIFFRLALRANLVPTLHLYFRKKFEIIGTIRIDF